MKWCWNHIQGLNRTIWFQIFGNFWQIGNSLVILLQMRISGQQFRLELVHRIQSIKDIKVNVSDSITQKELGNMFCKVFLYSFQTKNGSWKQKTFDQSAHQNVKDGMVQFRLQNWVSIFRNPESNKFLQSDPSSQRTLPWPCRQFRQAFISNTELRPLFLFWLFQAI